MPFSIRLLTKTHLLTLGLLTSAGIAGYAVTSYKKPFSAQAARPALSQDQRATEQPEAERATVRFTGFERAQILRPKKGPFFLMIENRTGLRELTYQINNEAGAKVNDKDMKAPDGKLFWSGVVDLPPGQYFLTELNHKEWSLELTVENN